MTSETVANFVERLSNGKIEEVAIALLQLQKHEVATFFAMLFTMTPPEEPKNRHAPFINGTRVADLIGTMMRLESRE